MPQPFLEPSTTPSGDDMDQPTATLQPVPSSQGYSPEEVKLARRVSRRRGLFAPDLLKAALKQSFVMLRPDIQWKNPVMFVVEVGTALTMLFTIARILGSFAHIPLGYLIALDVWLFLTVLFANFASALAEARGKAQADSLRKTRRETLAFRVRGYERGLLELTAGASGGIGIEETVSTDLKQNDVVLVEAGQFIPGDGEIIEGVASIDESAITG